MLMKYGSANDFITLKTSRKLLVLAKTSVSSVVSAVIKVRVAVPNSDHWKFSAQHSRVHRSSIDFVPSFRIFNEPYHSIEINGVISYIDLLENEHRCQCAFNDESSCMRWELLCEAMLQKLELYMIYTFYFQFIPVTFPAVILVILRHDSMLPSWPGRLIFLPAHLTPGYFLSAKTQNTAVKS